MTISFDPQPDIEEGLSAQTPRSGQALVDICAEIRGLLSDEEMDQLFARERDYGREIVLK